MSTSNYEEKGNVHLNMKLEAALPYHEVIGSLVVKYADSSHNILDIGCGLGHIESVVKASNEKLVFDIADAYELCLDTASRRGNVGSKYLIDELQFDVAKAIDKKYDVIIMSHVLEHLIFPAQALDDVLSLLNEGGVLIIAVPNPARPFVLLTNLFKSHYVNRGHVHSWDTSHWRNFLENIMGLDIAEYATDYVQLPKATRSRFIRSIGKVLVKLAPWWGFSNIAVIKKTAETDSVYKKWKKKTQL